ncbi:hypothetical protein ACPOL_3955 [Acidisarcina polymorpha]|uniref:Uncharacterized protein n=1 Tax=Acidisarcina polymorpha TaxID=2211140 RepID=A0A2Z5G351_9BACT|nr:hypothetical protein ACPOL_3955 [Acidisarcina polymorpha]
MVGLDLTVTTTAELALLWFVTSLPMLAKIRFPTSSDYLPIS